MPKRAYVFGYFLAAPVCVLCIFLNAYHTASDLTDYSKLWFTIAIVLSMVIDIVVWEPVKLTLLGILPYPCQEQSQAGEDSESKK